MSTQELTPYRLDERVFRMYMKCLSGKAVLRLEESLNFDDSLLGRALKSIRNPAEDMERRLLERLDKIEARFLTYPHRDQSYPPALMWVN
jgi:hypothetical protein